MRHCGCEVGFEMSIEENRCIPSLTPIRYIQSMEFDLSSKDSDFVGKVSLQIREA